MAQVGKYLFAVLASLFLLYLAAIWTRWELNAIGTGSQYATIGLVVVTALLCALASMLAASLHRTRRQLQIHRFHHRHLHTLGH